MSTKYYCIASRSNMLRPAEDRIRFATSYSAEYGWEWDCAERAEYYTLDGIGKMLESIDAARGSNYVGNGEASPDDLYIIPAEIARKIAARNADMSLYFWEDYEGPEDDCEAQGAWCEGQDVEECERAALDWDGVLSEEFGEGEPAGADDRAALEEAGYSASDAAGARVLARDSVGAVLFRIPGTMDYAVDGGSGDVVAELDAHDAFREWFV